MNDYSRGYFAVQLPMDADNDQVQQAINRIRRAFGLDDTGSVPEPTAEVVQQQQQAEVTPQQIANCRS